MKKKQNSLKINQALNKFYSLLRNSLQIKIKQIKEKIPINQKSKKIQFIPVIGRNINHQ